MPSGGRTRVYDLGRVEFLGHDGKTQVRHFANVSDFGVSGQVVAEAERGWKAFGGRVAFMAATAKALWRYRDQPIRYRLDGGTWHEDTITAFCVCNGKYFGGGMLVSPFARMDDGLFDITLWRKLGLSDFLTKKRMLYDGSHVTLPNTRCFRAHEVEAEPLNGARVLIDVDGEQPGLLPARFTILPGALKIKASS